MSDDLVKRQLQVDMEIVRGPYLDTGGDAEYVPASIVREMANEIASTTKMRDDHYAEIQRGQRIINELRAAAEALECRTEERTPDHYERRPTAGQCKCGLMEVPRGVDGCQWYWQRHSREACTLELPNLKCWCGLLRSEHLKGHDENAPRPADGPHSL